MAVNRPGRARTARGSAETIRSRLAEAEATLEAIRTGQIDALVVSGPGGEQTLTLEGATHPYFVLLNAMGDGAALLEPDGTILFGNRSLADIAGVSVESLRGSMFQGLVASDERQSTVVRGDDRRPEVLHASVDGLVDHPAGPERLGHHGIRLHGQQQGPV